MKHGCIVQRLRLLTDIDVNIRYRLLLACGYFCMLFVVIPSGMVAT